MFLPLYKISRTPLLYRVPLHSSQTSSTSARNCISSHGSIALAYLATAAWNVEREASGVVTARLCLACGGEDIADVIERLDIRYGIRSRRAPDGTLIDQNSIANPLDSAFDKSRSGSRIASVQCRFNCLVQAFVNQSRFARTRYSCDARH